MSDKTVTPRFFLEAVLDEPRSAAAGRQIYRDEERVEVLIAGAATLTRPVFRVTDDHRARWPEAYDRFKKGLAMAPEGKPLEEWPILSRAQVATLKAMEVHTVEQVAGLSDTAVQRIGTGGYGLRAKAKAYLDEAEEAALVEQITARNEALEQRVSEQDAKIAELTEICNRTFAELQGLRDRPSEIASVIPSSLDPRAVQPMRPAPDAGGDPFAKFSLPAAAAKRGPGRPRKEQHAGA